jgi:ABC-type phosphate transport system permease subunit
MLLLSPRNSNVNQMQPNKIREAVVMVNRKMLVVVMEGVGAAIIMARMAAQGHLSNTLHILVPKMAMAPAMIFTSDDWKYKLKIRAKAQSQSNN